MMEDIQLGIRIAAVAAAAEKVVGIVPMVVEVEVLDGNVVDYYLLVFVGLAGYLLFHFAAQ